ncbi:SDR family NAD(P)-dependent oxidoreductase [Kibdelosporangium phytohabitans]|uniref:SDR family NAD(P)-dependent oxidoreductase n=1 Tax=Kibdelosporangium phytohabitans TaxID=860235 RepID=UPI0009FB0374
MRQRVARVPLGRHASSPIGHGARDRGHDHGGLTILANNAGISWLEPFVDIGIDSWDRIIAVDLRGMFSVGQAVVRLLIRAGRAARSSTSSPRPSCRGWPARSASS